MRPCIAKDAVARALYNAVDANVVYTLEKSNTASLPWLPTLGAYGSGIIFWRV